MPWCSTSANCRECRIHFCLLWYVLPPPKGRGIMPPRQVGVVQISVSMPSKQGLHLQCLMGISQKCKVVV